MLQLKHALQPTSWSWRVLQTPFSISARKYSSQKISKPLRILFCGSDSFSSASLRALHNEQKANPEGLLSIDVLCRPSKRVGRSLKVFRDVPIKAVATELGLTVHERDTFTGWDLPKPNGEFINLIIAVSFGLFVPPRILKSAEYGGLNVHPSLLPNFRGAAPLQYTIMHGATHTGVTLQTLDHNSFDHGTILAQTPPPGIQLDLEKRPTFVDLLNLLTPIGADMLVTGIRDRVFVPPFPNISLRAPPANLIHAPKIKSEDKEPDWYGWDAAIIARRYRALGPLWNTIIREDGTRVRVKLDGIEEVELPWIFRPIPSEGHLKERFSSVSAKNMQYTYAGGQKVALLYIDDGEGIIIPAGREGMAIRVSHITIEGQAKKPASLAADTLREKIVLRDGVRSL